MTAAHCLREFLDSGAGYFESTSNLILVKFELFAVLNEVDLSNEEDGQQYINVKKYIIHPGNILHIQ